MREERAREMTWDYVENREREKRDTTTEKLGRRDMREKKDSGCIGLLLSRQFKIIKKEKSEHVGCDMRDTPTFSTTSPSLPPVQYICMHIYVHTYIRTYIFNNYSHLMFTCNNFGPCA